jgi:hypothetical protein
MGKLGHLVESLRARSSGESLHEDVIGSLLILAKDVGGLSNSVHGGFVGKFKDEKQIDSFMRTARMEYPRIDKYIRRTNLSDGRIELALSPRDAKKLR